MSADAKIVSADGHPSGLRDAIEFGIADWSAGEPARRGLASYIEEAVVAWLSVVSEGERNAVARALWENGHLSSEPDWPHRSEVCLEEADVALAASRGVLVSRIESDENGGTK